MLSKTAETTPKPKAVTADAAGSRSTGIIEADSTSDNKNALPRTALGNTDQSGRRKIEPVRMTAQTAAPIHGKLSPNSGNLVLTITFAVMTPTRIANTTASSPQSTLVSFGGSAWPIG